MHNAEVCGFMFISDELGEDVLCVVKHDEARAEFIAEVEFGSGDQIIAGIEDIASDQITDELLSAIKNQLEVHHQKDPRLVGVLCGQAANYTLYADKKFSQRPISGPRSPLTGEYYLADLTD